MYLGVQACVPSPACPRTDWGSNVKAQVQGSQTDSPAQFTPELLWDQDKAGSLPQFIPFYGFF